MRDPWAFVSRGTLVGCGESIEQIRTAIWEGAAALGRLSLERTLLSPLLYGVAPLRDRTTAAHFSTNFGLSGRLAYACRASEDILFEVTRLVSSAVEVADHWNTQSDGEISPIFAPILARIRGVMGAESMPLQRETPEALLDVVVLAASRIQTLRDQEYLIANSINERIESLGDFECYLGVLTPVCTQLQEQGARLLELQSQVDVELLRLDPYLSAYEEWSCALRGAFEGPCGEFQL